MATLNLPYPKFIDYAVPGNHGQKYCALSGEPAKLRHLVEVLAAEEKRPNIVVERRRIELPTFALRTRRSPS
jgi:hypothetical protein